MGNTLTYGLLPSSEGARHTPDPYGFSLPQRQNYYSTIRERTKRGIAPAFGPFLANLYRTTPIRDRELRSYAQLASRVASLPPGSPAHQQAMSQLASVPIYNLWGAIRRSPYSGMLQNASDFWKSQAYTHPSWMSWPNIGVAAHESRRTAGLGPMESVGGIPAEFWRNYIQSVQSGLGSADDRWYRAYTTAQQPQYGNLSQMLGSFLHGDVPLDEILRTLGSLLSSG